LPLPPAHKNFDPSSKITLLSLFTSSSAYLIRAITCHFQVRNHHRAIFIFDESIISDLLQTFIKRKSPVSFLRTTTPSKWGKLWPPTPARSRKTSIARSVKVANTVNSKEEKLHLNVVVIGFVSLHLAPLLAPRYGTHGN
jgi:hypothetical protein